MSSKSVIIIGGGLGGLFTGAILAKEGLSVTILEKNSTVGGGLQSFKRFDSVFDTGMHVIGGMQPNGNIRKLCRYLGIEDKVRIRNVDSDCTDRIYFAEDKKYYTIAQDPEKFIKVLSQYFPDEEQNLKNYIKAIYEITNDIDLFNLRPQESLFSTQQENFTVSANQFIAKYIKNEKLRSILAYMNPFYGGRKDQTPAYIHAIINVLYLNGPSRFIDGSYHFAELLASLIKENGGSVLTNRKVSVINTENKDIVSVTTSDGETYSADMYVSDIHPCTLLQLMDKKVFPKSYIDRLNEIPNSYSAFSIYIKLKEKTFPYINHSEYYMTRYDDVWNFGETDRPWPLGFLIMTPPDAESQEYATKILITAPMSFSRVRKWENTSVGKRGEDYLKWKEECANLLLEKTKEIHPELSSCIDKVVTASPLTIRDFYGVKDGALAGYSKDCNNIALSHISVFTKIRNLVLTGQNINLHGFCGVGLTSISTSEAILGRNYIINKINECSEAKK